jgi:hypothetical protein
VATAQLSQRPPPQFMPETMSTSSAATTLWRAVWRKNSKVKTKLPIADTVFINKEGQPSRWLFTSAAKGTVLKKSKQHSTWDTVYRAFEKKYNNQQRSIPKPNLDTPVARVWYRTSNVPRFLSLSDLSALCQTESGAGTVVQAHQLRGFQARSNVQRLQFHVVGRNGTNITYESTYNLGAGGAGGGTGALPIMSVDRVREEDGHANIENQSRHSPTNRTQNRTKHTKKNQKTTTTTKTSLSCGGIKSISLQVNETNGGNTEGGSTLLRVPSHDRVLNTRLSELTKYLAGMVEGRSRNTLNVRKMVVQYTIDPHGVAYFTDTIELMVSSTATTRPIDIPRAILFPAPDRPGGGGRQHRGSGALGGAGALSTADQRHVDFHRRKPNKGRQGRTTNAHSMFGQRTKAGPKRANAISLAKARCNGDFCSYHEDLKKLKRKQMEEDHQGEDPTYRPWKARDAKKNEWAQLQNDKHAGMAQAGEGEEGNHHHHHVVQNEGAATGAGGAAGVASPIRHEHHRSLLDDGRGGQTANTLLVAYRAISDARSSGLRHMPLELLRWHVTGRWRWGRLCVCVCVWWLWCGCGVVVVWLWCGCGVVVVWLWCGCGVVWLWCGLVLRFGFAVCLWLNAE